VFFFQVFSNYDEPRYSWEWMYSHVSKITAINIDLLSDVCNRPPYPSDPEVAPISPHTVSGSPNTCDATSVTGDQSEKVPTASETADGEEPNEEEKGTLRRVGESLPFSAWLIAIVELSERFTYYGMSGIFQNYIERPLDGSLGRGALGTFNG
jgi:hypothetical protein